DVVFDDGERVGFCQRQNAVADRRIRVGAGGVVEQRLHEERTRTMSAARRFQRFDVRAVRATRNAHEFYVMRAQLLEEHEVAGIIDEHGVTGREENARDEVEGLRGAERRDEVRRAARDAALYEA